MDTHGSLQAPLLDISQTKKDSAEAVIYVDGKDARVYRELMERLHSEVRVQNAILLTGLLAKLGDKNSEASLEKIRKTKELFPEFVGFTYQQFLDILDEIQ